jgi:flagellar L-ring protein FlgH
MTMPIFRPWTKLAITFAIRAILLSALSFGTAHGISLFDESTFRPLVADNKAFRVGDAITVQVYENSSANSSVDTNTQQKNDINASINKGPSKSIGQLGISIGGEFDGGGSTQRTNRLLATISVTVREILPNGDLRISGEQLLLVNDEKQRVNLQGRVRPYDVSDSNLVVSNRIADAKITYLGEGDVTDRSRRGWWRKLLDAIGF